MDLTRDTSIFVIIFIVFSAYFKYKSKILFELFKNNPTTVLSTKKKKIGLLTNELPPIIYGGVSTWVLNFY